MNRITPDQVLMAYARTGLVPAQSCWYELREGQWCGCALTALALDAGMPRLVLLYRDDDGRALNVLAALMDYSERSAASYAYGFYKGFDSADPDTDPVDPDWMKRALLDGWMDGIDAWAAVVQRYKGNR